MPSVRFTGSTRRNIHKKEWLGTAAIDGFGHIERIIDLPVTAYDRIEEGIAKGYIEGSLVLDDGRRVDWFLDRDASTKADASRGAGEGI